MNMPNNNVNVPEQKEQKSYKLYRNISIFVLTAVVLTVAWIFLFRNTEATTTDTVFVNEIVTLTNSDRKAAGLTELTVNKKLSDAAHEKALDMLHNNYFAHVSPSGKTPWSWIEAENYNYIYAGENLAINFKTAEATETAWMNSPSHRENIMNKNYSEIGVAEAEGVMNGQAVIVVVEMFGTEVQY